MKGAKLSQPGFVGRNDSQLDPNVLGAAFDVALNKQGGEPKYRVVTTGNGQVALVGVLARRIDSGDSKQGGPQRKQIAQQQSGYNASLEYSALDRYLRERAEVEIHKSAMN